MVSSGIRVSCRCYFCCFYYNPQIRDCQVANQNIRDIFDLNPLIRDRQEHIMIFNERLKTLLAERDVSWKQVSQELSIGKTQPKYWADNDTLPDGKTLVKLSHFFGVSVDYLLGNEERSATTGLDSDLTEQEKTLLAVYRASSEEVKLRIIQAVMNIKDESEKTHRVYRAARSSDNAEPVIVTRSQEDIDRLRNAKAVTCDEDL